MRNVLLTLVTSALLLSATAHATSCFPPDPEQLYQEHEVAVLAVPKAVSVLPRDAPEKGFPFPFRQTIIWQVLVSWKGPYLAGATFTTRTNFSGEPSCVVHSVHGNGPLLMYLAGKEPYVLGNAHNPGLAIDHFRYLEGLTHEP
jgi:hypothetical protein